MNGGNSVFKQLSNDAEDAVGGNRKVMQHINKSIGQTPISQEFKEKGVGGIYFRRYWS